LVRREDFARFSGFEAKVELHAPLEGRKRFKGRLLGVDGDVVRMLVDTASVNIPLASVARAKLVLTDELLAASAPRSSPPPAYAFDKTA
jgi:ribosome maturation factor RimP